MSVNRAIEAVELREEVMREQQAAPRRLLNGPTVTAEQEMVRKKAYQNVLRDLFRDEPSLRNE